jgi:hypothetical protein
MQFARRKMPQSIVQTYVADSGEPAKSIFIERISRLKTEGVHPVNFEFLQSETDLSGGGRSPTRAQKIGIRRWAFEREESRAEDGNSSSAVAPRSYRVCGRMASDGTDVAELTGCNVMSDCIAHEGAAQVRGLFLSQTEFV